MANQEGSKAFSLSGEEVWKSVKAFLWSFTSLALVLIGAIIALPDTDVPSWLIWIVPSAPALNALLYGLQNWLTDTRE